MNNDLLLQDQEHRQRALDAAASFIVQAPAGSGKTELLIQRFLTLLCHVQFPEEILAITFTKKAANEMRMRILRALIFASTEGEPESAHQKLTYHLAKKVLKRDTEKNWQLLSNPNQLRIQTIDALCAYITKQLPLLSHFGSQPDIADDPEKLYSEAAQTVLALMEERMGASEAWSDSISQLLLHLDNDLNKLHDLLVLLLAKRDQWLPYIHLDTTNKEMRTALEQQLALVISDSLENLVRLIPKECIHEWLAIARFAAIQATNPYIALCQDITTLPGSRASDKMKWLGLAQLLLTSAQSWRKRVDEKLGFPALAKLKNSSEKALHQDYRLRLTTLIEQLSHRDDLRFSLSELFSLPEASYEETQWQILQALLDVLKMTAAQLRLTFQQYGKVDFIENAQAAVLALGSDDHPTDLALAFDYRIQHILVDEFQDTSYTQYQLLERLTMGWETADARTLFVVGDPMQSIYRFREAEVGLFIRMRDKGIGQVKLIPLSLALNFRSDPKIVEWNNHHFQHIFPSFTDKAAGAVTYNPSTSFDTVSQPNVMVSVKGLLEPNNGVQADSIIALILETKLQHPNQNIAILVRSRSHLRDIIPALKRAAIPYRAVDIDPLASRPCIQDLLSLTCALLHPADRIAWLAVLRAPWCGLTLADLLVIAGDHPHSMILERLGNHELRARLSEDGQQRLARIFPILKNRNLERKRADLRTWIESTWLQLGGPACLSDTFEIDDVEVYFDLLSSIDQRNETLSIDYLKEKINHLYAASQHNDAILQIMTIHTAKGLEFDTVIIPHLERKLPNDSKPLLAWIEHPLDNDKMALLLAPIHATGTKGDRIYDYIIKQQKIKSDYEIDRLFYVATTRAKKRLHLFFNAKANDENEIKTESGSFLEKLWPLIEHKQNEMIHQSYSQNSGDQKTVKTTAPITRLIVDWKNPMIDKSMNSVSLHRQKEGFMLADTSPKLIGIVIHQLLQRLTQEGISWWTSMNSQQRYIQNQLNQINMPLDQMKSGITLVQKAIENMINDSRGQWILERHQEAHSEFAISGVLDAKIEKVVIDRTFVDEKGTRWIIDYKTTSILEDEQEKHEKQMKKYAALMQLFDPRPVKLGLYFPMIPAWQEVTYFRVP